MLVVMAPRSDLGRARHVRRDKVGRHLHYLSKKWGILDNLRMGNRHTHKIPTSSRHSPCSSKRSPTSSRHTSSKPTSSSPTSSSRHPTSRPGYSTTSSELGMVRE